MALQCLATYIAMPLLLTAYNLQGNVTLQPEKFTRSFPMWISRFWHAKCNGYNAKINLMKKTIVFNLAIILLYYFLLQLLLPF
jgi:hypothetical protein